MPDYKFDTQELSQIKGGSESTAPTDKAVPQLPPSACGSNLCATARDEHLGECSVQSCVNQA